MGCAVLIAIIANGCSTVVFSDNPASERSASIERAALIDAASAVSAVKWPRVDRASWGSRLVGFASGDDGIGKDEAVEAYLASLGPIARRHYAVMADARSQLGAASALVYAAHAAAEAVRPVAADVNVVETAIGDLRESRDIYLASLKAISRDGETVDNADLRVLKSEFNEAIEDLGAAADILADRVSRDRTETLARPGMRRSVNGSL